MGFELFVSEFPSTEFETVVVSGQVAPFALVLPQILEDELIVHRDQAELAVGENVHGS
jgi:hypothetical protein